MRRPRHWANHARVRATTHVRGRWRPVGGMRPAAVAAQARLAEPPVSRLPRPSTPAAVLTLFLHARPPALADPPRDPPLERPVHRAVVGRRPRQPVPRAPGPAPKLSASNEIGRAS